MSKSKGNNKHTHKLVKSGPVWKCALPACRFFVYFKQEYILLGRESVCNDCGDKFVMDEDSLKEDIPTCFECKNSELVHKMSETELDKFINSHK